jgi:hypothetical protein
MDAQQEHDRARVKLTKKGLNGSKKRLEALLKKKAKAAPSGGYDPIASAMRNHPGLTREKAEEMAEAFGF